MGLLYGTLILSLKKKNLREYKENVLFLFKKRLTYSLNNLVIKSIQIN